MSDETQKQELGINHHVTFPKGDVSALSEAVETAKSNLKAEKQRHEEASLKLKQDAALAIKKIKDQLVEDEKKESDLYQENTEELTIKVQTARGHLDKGIKDDLGNAEKKAREQAQELKYLDVRFNGETDKSWSFVFTNKAG